MGKKTKLRSNPALAHPHAAGAKVQRIQILAHSQYGAICYVARRFWALHANLAGKSYEKLERLHRRVLTHPVDASNMRTLANDEVLQRFYGEGSSMISNSVRAIQHLAQEMEQYSESGPLTRTTALGRLREATSRFAIELDEQHPGHQAMAEMILIRDAVEHPTQSNVFTGDPNHWDRVPLAWMLSDRPTTTFPHFAEWFANLVDQWELTIEKLPKETVTLNIQRGIQSDLPSKKSPRTT